MSDIGKSKVNYLEEKRPFLAQYVPGRKVPVCNAQIMEGTHLREQEKSVIKKVSTTRFKSRQAIPLHERKYRERFERREGPTLTRENK